jgi:hypothetical protein
MMSLLATTMKTIAKLVFNNNSTFNFDRENTLKRLWNEQVVAANISEINEPTTEQQQLLTPHTNRSNKKKRAEPKLKPGP